MPDDELLSTVRNDFYELKSLSFLCNNVFLFMPDDDPLSKDRNDRRVMLGISDLFYTFWSVDVCAWIYLVYSK